ncbi:MAG: adenylyltransferase/cytidyltransferase family protein [Deltaproteobacteria bacterium]|uniref:Adenylyltransferase/cytidyltransferase family protein n=1 Tax=Candidatus Zymogenus saltonus TaxID=2844893 RepID=A0A9D8KCZ4_9DELT|nr:adenylyltransferase/cytidyltransferase family protein [Candidatus Zymogenus saltonus]
MKKKKSDVIGYTTGVFDLFHIGHLNILRNAKRLCDKLIVGVTTDELLMDYKKKKAVIPFVERCEIVRAIRYVDVVVAQDTMDKIEAFKKLKFNVMFVGDDWYESDKWKKIEGQFEKVGVKIIYFPYTKGTSSTMINQILVETREEIQAKKERLKKLLDEKGEELDLTEEDIKLLFS